MKVRLKEPVEMADGTVLDTQTVFQLGTIFITGRVDLIYNNHTYNVPLTAIFLLDWNTPTEEIR